jgi:hypothetical protein
MEPGVSGFFGLAGVIGDENRDRHAGAIDFPGGGKNPLVSALGKEDPSLQLRRLLADSINERHG